MYLIRQTFFIQPLHKNIQFIQFNKGITQVNQLKNSS